MAKKIADPQLQTPASADDDTPEKQRAAGMGGSYSIDPRTGSVELAHRTESGSVSRKAPLKDEEGNEVADETPAASEGATQTTPTDA